MSAVAKLSGDWEKLRFVQIGGSYETLMDRLKAQFGIEELKGADLSHMYIERIHFPENISFRGAKLNGTILDDCSIPAGDFTGAETGLGTNDPMILRFCSVQGVQGLTKEQIGTTFEDLMGNGRFDIPAREDDGKGHAPLTGKYRLKID